MKNELLISGVLEVRRNGALVGRIDNLVVTVGLNWIADRMKNNSAVMNQMKIGSGTTAPAAGDTDLESELAAVSLDSTTVSTNTVTYVATFPAGTGTGTVTEACVWESTGSTMLCRTTFTAVSKGAIDSLELTWVITVSAS